MIRSIHPEETRHTRTATLMAFEHLLEPMVGSPAFIYYFKTLTMNEIISFSFLGFHSLSFRRNIVPASPNSKGNQGFGSINANIWQRKWKGTTKRWGITIPLLNMTREDKQVYVLLHVTIKDYRCSNLPPTRLIWCCFLEEESSLLSGHIHDPPKESQLAICRMLYWKALPLNR